MTKSTTKKTAAKKTASKPTKTVEPKQMEASATPPAATGTPATNTVRVCWAAKTLVEEFTELFPETPVEYSGPDGRNTMLDVTFDITAVPDTERDGATALLELVQTDERVQWVIAAEDGVLVSFRSSARTQDSRYSFGLADAWDVLTDGYEDELDAHIAESMQDPEYAAAPNLDLNFTDEDGSL